MLRGDASTATTPASQEFSAGAGGKPSSKSYSPHHLHHPPHQSSSSTYHPPNSHVVYRVGIYGWRKRCLYLLVIVLSAIVIVNIALTVWIIKVMDFSINGMGRLKIVKGGVRLDGVAEFLHSLYATDIRSRKDQPLKIESSRNITINARNTDGRITSRLFVGNSRVEAIAESFVVRNSQGDLLFEANGQETSITTKSIRLTGEGGVHFAGSIMTPLVRSESSEQLRIESLTRTLRVQGPQGVGIESKTGDILAACHKDLRLKSNEGAIILDSERVEFKHLKTALPTTRGRPYPGIYQLCVCENGRLFLTPPDGHCQADNIVCK